MKIRTVKAGIYSTVRMPTGSVKVEASASRSVGEEGLGSFTELWKDIDKQLKVELGEEK